MDNKFLSYHLLIIIIVPILTMSKNVHISYESSERICERCVCNESIKDSKEIFIMDCTLTGLKQLISGWPETFGKNHTGKHFLVYYSGNVINTLQQIPETDAIIKVFSCRHCKLDKIESGVFLDASNIIKLDLSWNQLTGDVFQPDIFRGPYNEKKYAPIKLESIDLSYNQIQSLDRDIFEHTPNLNYLSLRNNPLGVLDSVTIIAISSLPKIMHLDLSSTKLSEVPNELFRNMPKLTKLLINDNRITHVPESLSLLGSSLKSLYIGENLIKKIDKQSFLGLKQLTLLNISAMYYLDEIDPAAFSYLTSLEVLILNDNTNLSRIDLSGLRGCVNLKHIELTNCALRTISMDTVIQNDTIMMNFAKLRQIKLERNPWHCDCKLQKSLTELERYENNKFQNDDDDARCKTPYELSATLLSNLLNSSCTGNETIKTPRPPVSPPVPPFLRPRSIVLSILSVLTVVLVGLIIGFCIVLLKKKLNKGELDLTPTVRYTTVRNIHPLN